MVSLAAIYYRNVVNKACGPVTRISVDNVTLANGETGWQALAYLHSSIWDTDRTPKLEIYGEAAGTGTHRSRAVACHKAVSEALERWAFLHTFYERRSGVGMEVEPYSTGFAAWPGPFTASARARAFNEAVERWAVPAWWDGLVNHQMIEHPKCRVAILNLPWTAIKVAIVDAPVGNGLQTYAFAADMSVNAAVSHAIDELERNREVLTAFAERSPVAVADAAAGLSELMEKRLIYFATGEGKAKFEARIARLNASTSDMAPKLQIDTRIIGPWDRYCRVWRCLFEPIWDHTDHALDRFMF